jgi:hypothetical protein
MRVLAPHPVQKFEDLRLLFVMDCLFNIFAVTSHIWRPHHPYVGDGPAHLGALCLQVSACGCRAKRCHENMRDASISVVRPSTCFRIWCTLGDVIYPSDSLIQEKLQNSKKNRNDREVQDSVHL